MAETYRALVVDKAGEGTEVALIERCADELPAGEVTIRVAYSSVNYKDGLATLAKGGVVRKWPLVPGIDLAGTVAASRDPRFAEGDEVLVTGYDLGVAHDGGFAELARVPADWVVKRPDGLSLRECMAFGTAGFTAALALDALDRHGVTPAAGPAIVTGATGGVGSIAVSMLSGLGFEVAASTGKAGEHDYLRSLGASRILSRDEVSAETRPLEAATWAAAVDQVGGSTLPWLMARMTYRGAIASTGLTGGPAFKATVLPFLLRSVAILGIDSVFCPMAERLVLWQRMADDLKPPHLTDMIAAETGLDGVKDVLASILKGGVRGRTVVRIA